MPSHISVLDSKYLLKNLLFLLLSACVYLHLVSYSSLSQWHFRVHLYTHMSVKGLVTIVASGGSDVLTVEIRLMVVTVAVVVMEALMMWLMAADGGPDELAEVPSALVVLVATMVLVIVVLMQDGGGSGSSSILVLMKGPCSSVWVTNE